MYVDDEGKIQVKGTRILQKILDAGDYRVVLLEGGSSSSKTFSMCQAFIVKGNEETNKVFTISRKTGPALRDSVEADFIEWLNRYELYNEDFHHKTNRTYHMNDNVYNFGSVDMASKKKGLRHNYVWMNEGDEYEYNDYLQFILRLRNPSLDGKRNQLFIDFNPTDEDDHFLNKLKDRDDSILIPSSYLDNSFLDQDSIEEIERLKDSDPEMWLRYGLGKRSARIEKIYPTWKRIDRWPEYLTDFSYGLDFGFNHPTALIRCGYVDGVGLFWKQEIYQSYLTGPTLIGLMNEKGIDKDKQIYADPSRPDLIEEITDAGYTIEGAENDVYPGIMKVKGSGVLHITDDSPDVQKEAKKYSWKKDPRTLKIMDQPVKIWDDAMDGGRYGSTKLISGGFIRTPKTKLIRRVNR